MNANFLQFIHDEIASLIPAGKYQPLELATLSAAQAAIRATLAHETVATLAQPVANALIPQIVGLVPALAPFAALIAAVEPLIGPAAQWLHDEIAPRTVIDDQAGSIVHDAGDPAPTVGE